MSQIYLITGASRGLGAGMVKTFLLRSNTTVIAAVRSPAGSAAQALEQLPKGAGSKLLLVKLDSSIASDAAAAVKTIEAAGIDHIDTVIANAGISDDFSRMHEVPIAVFERHMNTNAYGVLHLVQAVYPLLSKSKEPRFVGVGSAMGSIGGMDQRYFAPSGAYGPSKAVLHYMVRRLHFENRAWTAFVLDPGFAATDMGSGAAKTMGIDGPALSAEECVKGMVSVIDESTREKTGGRNMRYDGGDDFPW